ncbi:hypothetical protein [Kitasatospora viridis]|uniref:Uncharacterized protein n=1 Tax=Kitasatospora viridis TaxID=281105 RepID=A0A561SFJ9_9ACTN|nr:hypothetical protein [Kitasatospora viridis]TWF73597.1 hypothetical protein FHX73_15210 [Kitasatospora viridis]
MNQDRSGRRPPGFVQFRLLCPCCAGGVQHRARAGLRRHGDGTITTGSYDLPERCPDCDGVGWLILGSGEWKVRRRA